MSLVVPQPSEAAAATRPVDRAAPAVIVRRRRLETHVTFADSPRGRILAMVSKPDDNAHGAPDRAVAGAWRIPGKLPATAPDFGCT
jgi:hypothetical protein